jgi:hypothetical protein
MGCNIGAEAIPISIGSLFGFSSGRIFFHRMLRTIGLQFRAEKFKIPQQHKALSLAVIF